MGKETFAGWTKEELIREVAKLKRQKKYGIVWEDKPEIVAELCKKKFPILTEDRSKRIQTADSKPMNIFIEGDNYHALSVLNYTHKGMVDVIYIDPPYNTGAKDWKYNNDFVDINDQWRHSKWLSMMSKRLLLAKKLLKNDGVLICAIDDNEFHHLGCLLEDVFSGWEMHCITIVHNPRGVQGNNFSYTHEYAYFVFKKSLQIMGPRKLSDEEIDWSNLRNWGGESLRTDARNCFYPILIKKNKIRGFGDVLPNDLHPEKQTEDKNGIYYVWPIDKKGIERKWRYARNTVESIKDILKVIPDEDRIEIKIGKPYGTVRTVWKDKKYDAAEYGTKLVHALVPKIHFDFPKSVFNTYDCLAPIVNQRKDAIILDYFAGSGTTGHAVLMLNKGDGGNRKFILCTNNENGIAVKVCYPRIRKVIKGHRDYPDITGIPASLLYFKTDFVDGETTDRNKKLFVEKSTEMLCLKEDCYDQVKKGASYRVFRNPQGKYLGVVYEDEGIRPIIREIIKKNQKFIVYVFSLDESAREEDFEEAMELVELKPIPAVIMNVYKRLFR